MSQPQPFLFVTCQVGAEAAVKAEVARQWPDFRFAYSRPGFLTFKVPAEPRLPASFDLQSIFARAHGFSVGKAVGQDMDERARAAWQAYPGRPPRRIHVWPRDTAAPGEHGFEPSITEEALHAEESLRRSCPWPQRLAENDGDPLAAAEPRELVLDCILLEPSLWWIGYHRVRSIPSRWPGGMMPLELPPDAPSRAWLKMEEALRWSELPMPLGARCVEIGSAPGGASWALLNRGFMVTGIDPAEMDPRVLAHPNFTHIRRRASQVRRRDFRKIRWLLADMNVAPTYTLDAVEAIVTHREVQVRGLLLTLKLLTWSMAQEVPEHLQRVQSWGFNVVRARQLQHNRQEICVAALKKPFRRTTTRASLASL